jgi:hypothetical protein
MSTGSRARLWSLLLASAVVDDLLKPTLLMRRGYVLVSNTKLGGAPRKGNNWSEIARRYLEREVKYPSPVWTSPNRCAYCGSKAMHYEDCGNPVLWVNNVIED